MNRLAIYPGTFDPFTNGHLDIALRSVRLFDSLVIAVTTNAKKTPLFSVPERKELIKKSLPEDVNISVESFDGLLVDYAEKRGSIIVIRGLRAVSDFEYELQMALLNRRLKPSIETIFKMPSEEYSFLTSSAVKEIALLGGCVDGLVPAAVKSALIEKFKEKN
ncbi:pantetheine-phosphate adenylyltransferase [Candidatus Magnetominusculus xianensis]|uniref:Phosphopantetheine adenylyltransferase n=1 Tax=Candidatus Magnetominusculus xianensis TaxID=1748249 RepID=A0ABR5SCQ9_9BACT|nr:pantetheine-phosphate adenylyltransferase [Candidatus Magnetominusculus xianensis]KWT82082.1 phosphopantetheine adenylyltransferase [Candidatus Magnetominusculus xianensis]MBF0405467.1 pantetheine-phosphate adenylyltransferase [Nitrospirota bacterium]